MSELSHLDGRGRARMVEVGEKPETARVAVAEGTVSMSPSTVRLVLEGKVKKGDVLAVARLAGIQGAKRTPDLVPLCHPVRLTSVEVAIEAAGEDGFRVRATARAVDRTGVEMEAMTAVAAACLALYDMVKGVERGVALREIRLLEKSGGRSGRWVRGAD